MKYQLRISGRHSRKIYNHLFPGDGKEAVLLAMCGHHILQDGCILSVHQVFNVPHEQCERDVDFVHWKTDLVIPFIEKAAKLGLSILKFHSHPTGFSRFSLLDNESDGKLFPSLYGWIDGEQPHGSVVALPDGTYFGRIVSFRGRYHDISKISISGDRIQILNVPGATINKDISLRNIQTFGEGTVDRLRNMKIAVVGASGTGSPTIEQLARLGVGELIIVDPDIVELKNLNRILNSTLDHAKKKMRKVDILKEAISKIGFGTKVNVFPKNLYNSREAINELINCDVIFGCIDSVDGRHLLNQIATFYCIPYFDLGIKLDADGVGGINQVNGVVHYIQPGGSSLMSRGVYTSNGLEAASLMRQNPEEYERRMKEKYIVNVPVNSPAVISINMFVSSFAINEFLDRVHPYKATLAEERAINWISITEGLLMSEVDGEPDDYLVKRVGRGDCSPFLEMMEL